MCRPGEPSAVLQDALLHRGLEGHLRRREARAALDEAAGLRPNPSPNPTLTLTLTLTLALTLTLTLSRQLGFDAASCVSTSRAADTAWCVAFCKTPNCLSSSGMCECGHAGTNGTTSMQAAAAAAGSRR